MAKWIYDLDCFIVSCCNIAYDISKFEREGDAIRLPCECPNCGRQLEPPKESEQNETDYYDRREGGKR